MPSSFSASPRCSTGFRPRIRTLTQVARDKTRCQPEPPTPTRRPRHTTSPPRSAPTHRRTSRSAIAEHAHTIGEVLRRIPNSVAPDDRAAAELMLTDLAANTTPESVRTAGIRILGYLNPDGRHTADQDRARQRSLRLCGQDSDLMSRISGVLDPHTRALLDAVLAKWAAPGQNNPEDPQSPRGTTHSPDADTSLLEAAAGRDRRTQEQRNHDGLNSGGLGEHNGLPMHLVATASLRNIEDEAGAATTATGTRGGRVIRYRLVDDTLAPLLAMIDLKPRATQRC